MRGIRRSIGSASLLVAVLWAGQAVAEEMPPAAPGAPAPATVAEESPLALTLQWGGYVRAGYDHVFSDGTYSFIGENNGFVLQNARLALQGSFDNTPLTFTISLDAADEVNRALNTPQGELDVATRDAWIRYDILPMLGVQLGQFKAPFAYEELRSRRTMPFASSAVGLEGVRVGRGFEEPGLRAGRQLGLMVSSGEPIAAGPLGIGYALALTNGNGQNRSLNDNSSLAFFGRLELGLPERVQVGAAFFLNERREGEPPNLFDESDLGLNVDLLVTIAGLEVYGQFTQVTTSYDTVSVDDATAVAWHAHVLYDLRTVGLPLAPGYRIASYDPRSGDDAPGSGARDLLYHTVGLNAYHATLPLMLQANYTITGENASRELANDRLELMLQLAF